MIERLQVLNALHIHAASVPLRPTDVRTPRTPPAFSHCLMVGKKVTPTRARVDPSHRARVQSLAVVGDVAQSSRHICVDLFFRAADPPTGARAPGPSGWRIWPSGFFLPQAVARVSRCPRLARARRPWERRGARARGPAWRTSLSNLEQTGPCPGNPAREGVGRQSGLSV